MASVKPVSKFEWIPAAVSRPQTIPRRVDVAHTANGR